MSDLFADLLAKRPTRVSYSAISTWESCGAAYKYSYIIGMERPAGEAANRGTRLHKSGELFIKGELPLERLPVDYWKVKPMMDKYKKLKAKSEEVLCVNREWEIVEDKAPGIFIKSVIDLHWMEKKVLHVRDLKTGKIYHQEHTDQLQLYGTKGLIKYPEAKEVVVAGVYIDQGRVDTEAVYPRKMLPMLIERWTERALKVLTDTEFQPRPSSDNCRYCAFNAKKGGPCEAGSRY